MHLITEKVSFYYTDCYKCLEFYCVQEFAGACILKNNLFFQSGLCVKCVELKAPAHALGTRGEEPTNFLSFSH